MFLILSSDSDYLVSFVILWLVLFLVIGSTKCDISRIGSFLHKPKPIKNSKIDDEIKRLFDMVDNLGLTYSVRTNFNDVSLKQSFDERNFRNCINILKDRMGIGCHIILRIYRDDRFPWSHCNGVVNIPTFIPLIGTDQFNCFEFIISIRQSTKIKYETFVYTILHEMSHILLHTMRHRLKESEEATDILVMMHGFTNIMREGMVVEHRTGDILRDGFSRRLNDETELIGYLGRANFDRVANYLQTKM
jgi:hypothetical protein